MRLRVVALFLFMCTVWGISQITAQDMTSQETFAIQAAKAAKPELGNPSNRRFEALPPTSSSNLGCAMEGIPARDLGQTVTPFRVELTYPDGVYVVHVTGGGSFTQLCDPKFGDLVYGQQPSFGALYPQGGDGPGDFDAPIAICQLVGEAQPTLYAYPRVDAPVLPGDVLVGGRSLPIGANQTGDWYQVLNAAGQPGWVQLSQVIKEGNCNLPMTAVTDLRYQTNFCYVNSINGTANVRESYDTDAELVREISRGQFWQVYARTENGTWYFIKPGWIAVRAVETFGDCGAVPVNMDLYPGSPDPRATPTTDPNFVPTATPTLFLGTPLPQENVCPAGFSGYKKPRLKVGIQTASVAQGKTNNRVRTDPNTNGAVITEAVPGTVLDRVITGPACGEGYVWWLVEVNGVQGWTVESSADLEDYFLEPQTGITATPPPSPTLDPNIPTATPTIFGGTPLAPEYMCPPGLPGLLPPRLVIGEQTARVVPGGPDSRLRSQPNSGTTLLGQVPESTVLDVLAGPACGPKSDVWWLVEVNGIQAWTAESRGTTYYVEPMPGFEPTAAPTATPTLDPSLPSPTPIPPTATPTLFLGTPLPQEAVCPPDFAGYTPPRLKVGIQTAGVVAGRTNNRVRSEPNTNGSILTEAEPESVFDRVLAGPACGEGYVWWLVEVNGVQGWTAESSADGYFLEALPGITATPSPSPSPTLTLLAVTPSATLTPSITPTLFLGTPLAQNFVCPSDFADSDYMEPRLIVGAQTARILEGGSGNRLRAEPGTNGMQIGRAEPGQVLDRVLAGPACAEGYVWWLVEANGITSWTAESDGDDYYIEPLITATPVASPTLTPAG